MTNKGTAAEARKMFIAKIRRSLRVAESLEAKMLLNGLILWLKAQQERFNKRKGGIGRR